MILWESVLSDCWSGRQNGKFIQCACAAHFDVEESFRLKGIPSNDGLKGIPSNDGELPPKVRAKTGSESCGDAVSQAVSLVVLWGVDVFMFMC